ncbi:MAG TPA: hypothetical protein VG406_19470 [Isosphaeraceae bacterium]|jgi:hypothetical protein|nr:hypothetical protein [Isosphaeraceae bacterium]
MPVPEPTPDDLEPDSRFPSGPWTGFFLQKIQPVGKHWMELDLTFRKGRITGEGRDRIGAFLMTGRYDVESGKCRWTKRYIEKHDIVYRGYNEGKGIWGTWEDPHAPWHRDGFHIWPVAMGDPTQQRLAEEAELPAPAEAEPVAVPG